jgi:hypothetical protein
VPAAGTPGLPNSDRQAATAALTGFQSEIARSQAGIPEVGTNELETMVTGKASGTRLSAVASFFTSSPRNTPAQVTAYRNRTSSANAATVPAAPWCARQPASRPIPAMIARPSPPVTMSAPARPNGTASLAIGIDRNRSITPLLISAATPVSVVMTPVTEVITNSPGIRYSR